MATLILLVVWFGAYWVGMAAIILFDARRQRAVAKAAGKIDFVDRSPVPFMLWGLLCGPLPLTFYFGTSRKNALGWIVGAAIGIGWILLFGFLFSLIEALAPGLRS